MDNIKKKTISNAERIKKRKEFRSRYKHIINGLSTVATERGITYEKLDELESKVNQYKPVIYKNPVKEEKIGRYRSPERRKCATTDMEIINFITHKLEKDPPSFLEAGPREKLYFNPEEELTIGIVTSGGIAPGLNTVVHSIVHMHTNVYKIKTRVLGFLCGFEGLEEKRYDLLTAEKTIKWIHSGGTELFTIRKEKKTGSEKDKLIASIIDALKEERVNILYVIGGDGSLTFAHEIAQKILEKVHEGDRTIVVAGIPKTMDNDILWVWHSFGFDTAVEEATKMINAVYNDIKSAQRIGLIQLFGRDAGFVAAHATLASGLVDAVLVPEIKFRIEPLLEYVEKKVVKNKYALIVVAEGAAPEGTSKEIIKKKLKSEGYNPDDITNPRVNVRLAQWRLEVLAEAFENHFRNFAEGRHQFSIIQPRYLVRAIPPNSVDQIHCQRLADLAVHNALAGYTDFMISQWLTEYVLVPLKLVAEQIDPSTGKRQTKKIPPGGIFWTAVTNSTGQPSFE